VSGLRHFNGPTTIVNEPTKKINLDTKEEPNIILVSTSFVEVKEALTNALQKYKDVFA